MKKKTTKKIPQRLVAQDAGVSRSTVSLVLRGSTLVTRETRERVLASAARLGYVSKTPARQAPAGTGRVIGVVFPDVSNIFYTSLLVGINEFYDNVSDYSIFFNSTFDSLEKQQNFLRELLRYPVAGLIIAPAAGTAAGDLAFLKEARIPTVFCPRYIDGMDVSFVGCDYSMGAYMATTHLIENRHRHIAFLGATEEISPMAERLRGYRMALAASALPFDDALLLTGPVTSRWGREAARELLRRASPPTAILCYNDVVARGVMQALAELRLQPGEDVALIGFDNTSESESSELSTVSFYVPQAETDALRYRARTSVSSRPYQWGYEAAKVLYRHITGELTETVRVVFPQTLVIRASSKKRF